MARPNHSGTARFLGALALCALLSALAACKTTDSLDTTQRPQPVQSARAAASGPLLGIGY
jgi:hypothetical protein